jgi:hypothetical protein
MSNSKWMYLNAEGKKTSLQVKYSLVFMNYFANQTFCLSNSCNFESAYNFFCLCRTYILCSRGLPPTL